MSPPDEMGVDKSLFSTLLLLLLLLLFSGTQLIAVQTSLTLMNIRLVMFTSFELISIFVSHSWKLFSICTKHYLLYLATGHYCHYFVQFRLKTCSCPILHCSINDNHSFKTNDKHVCLSHYHFSSRWTTLSYCAFITLINLDYNFFHICSLLFV